MPSEAGAPSPTIQTQQVEPNKSIQLDNPRGIAIGEAAEIYVADSGDPSTPFPGRVLQISPSGEVDSILARFRAISADASGETYVFGLSDVATSGDTLYALLGVGAFLESPIYAENHLIALAPDGEITDLFSASEFESAHDPDAAGIDSNATGLTTNGEESVWITDAAGNWVAQLVPTDEDDEDGQPLDVSTITVFPEVDGEDAVPTGVAVGPDGNAYVALFRCQQPTAGKGGVARINPNGSYEIVVEGLSNPIDVAFDATGRMYMLEFAVDYAPATGRLLAIQDDGSLATVLEHLTFPTSLAISEQGDVYVTEIASPAGGSA